MSADQPTPLVEPGPPLASGQRERYSRHLLLEGFGELAQRRLLAARVLVVGAGGLGSPTLAYLAAAGVGTLGVIDDDVVEVSNLQRQVIHDETRLGQAKVASAAARVQGLNSAVAVRSYPERLTVDNVARILADYDLVVDGTDNFATRYLLNDACAAAGKPYVWASILRFDGQLSVFWAGRGPCYRCVFPRPPAPGLVPGCAEGGVLGVVCGLLGSAQAAEAIKLITGVGTAMIGRLAILNALTGSWVELPVRADPACPTCGAGAADGAPAEPSASVNPAVEEPVEEIEVEELAAWLEERTAGSREFVLLDVRTAPERSINTIPGAQWRPLEDVLASGLVVADDVDVVLHCKSGGRSATAARAVGPRRRGRTLSLAGGVAAWVDRIDPSQARY